MPTPSLAFEPEFFLELIAKRFNLEQAVRQRLGLPPLPRGERQWAPIVVKALAEDDSSNWLSSWEPATSDRTGFHDCAIEFDNQKWIIELKAGDFGTYNEAAWKLLQDAAYERRFILYFSIYDQEAIKSWPAFRDTRIGYGNFWSRPVVAEGTKLWLVLFEVHHHSE